MDRRIKKTRDAIFTAFEELLAEKRYEQITVSDIIDRANIGRSTFYAHFETKDALLEELCHEVFGHVFGESLESEATHDFSHDDRFEAHVTHVLYHLGEDMDLLRGLVAQGEGSVFVSIFKSHLSQLFAGVADVAGVPKDYALNHLVCDFVEAVRWWTANPSYSPEDVSSFFLATSLPAR